jgi:small subunit ribosomal protein S4
MKLFLKGTRCETPKCAIEKRDYPPGMHGKGGGKNRRRKATEYALQLREKQKLRRIFGLMEKPFRAVYARAESEKGITGENLLRALEMRLDTVVHKAGWAQSRAQARQIVSHGHVKVNGRRCDVPSARLDVGDAVVLSEKMRGNLFVKESAGRAKERGVPAWLRSEPDQGRVEVAGYPSKDEIGVPVQEHMVVELYSK